MEYIQFIYQNETLVSIAKVIFTAIKIRFQGEISLYLLESKPEPSAQNTMSGYPYSTKTKFEQYLPNILKNLNLINFYFIYEYFTFKLNNFI